MLGISAAALGSKKGALLVNQLEHCPSCLVYLLDTHLSAATSPRMPRCSHVTERIPQNCKGQKQEGAEGVETGMPRGGHSPSQLAQPILI